ncbi:MAG: hypothetical protein AB7J34_08975 [Limisphaerales bacterium]
MTLLVEKQKVIIYGAVVIAAMSLCPPWKETRDFTSGSQRIKTRKNLHYELIFTPPPKYSQEGPFIMISIDWERLIAQYIAAMALTTAAWTIALPNKNSVKAIDGMPDK